MSGFEMRSDRKRIEADALYAALKEIVNSGQTDIDPRISYVEIQVNRETLADAQNLLAIYADRSK